MKNINRVRTILPAYHISKLEIDSVLEKYPSSFYPPYVIFNDNDRSTIEYLKYLQKQNLINLFYIPFPVGKAEALRCGIKKIIKETAAEVIVQFDGRSKQPVWQIEEMYRALIEHDVDLIIGDRYAKQNLEHQYHRKAITNFMQVVVQYCLGYSFVDTVCGTRAYLRDFAVRLLLSRAFGYGAEIEQLIICYLTNSRVRSFPLTSDLQQNFTNAEKIEDNIIVLLSYSEELSMNIEIRKLLSNLMVQIKRRATFDFPMNLFGVQVIFQFTYIENGEKMGAYLDQNPRDAYSISSFVHNSI